MSAGIVPFAFEGVEVRTLALDGAPWFVLTDLCTVLGLSNPSVVANRIDDADLSHAEVSSAGQRRTVMIVNESGMYEVVIRSDKPEAASFRRWITSEVLPSIRRTGSYNAADDPALPATFLEALEALVERERANQQLAIENAHLTPRAIAWDAIASAEGDFSVGQAANMLGRAGVPNMGPQRLFRKLEQLGWIYRGEDRAWRPYAHRVDKGYLGIKPQFHYNPGTGEKVVDAPQLRVTLKGVERLRQILHSAGAPIVRAVVSA